MSLRAGFLAGFPPVATLFPEPAGLPLFLPPVPSLPDAFPAVRLAFFFDLAMRTSLLPEEVLL